MSNGKYYLVIVSCVLGVSVCSTRELEMDDFYLQSPLTQPSNGASDGIARQGARMSQRDKDIPLDEPITGEKRWG